MLNACPRSIETIGYVSVFKAKPHVEYMSLGQASSTAMPRHVFLSCLTRRGGDAETSFPNGVVEICFTTIWRSWLTGWGSEERESLMRLITVPFFHCNCFCSRVRTQV